MPVRQEQAVWRNRLRAIEREYRAIQIALDWLDQATPDDRHQSTTERGWDDVASADIYQAATNLEATYLIRMYTVFERAVGSFHRLIAVDRGREVDGEVIINLVGVECGMDATVISSVQEVRRHRNTLVHQSIEMHAQTMLLDDAGRVLLAFLSRLPAVWR